MDATCDQPADRDADLSRLLNLSDGIFAIATTLLVFSIPLPSLTDQQAAHELARRLLALAPRFVSYGISFAIIGIYWMAHHRLFRYIERYDRVLLWLNLVFLFFVAFIPFPTDVFARYGEYQAAVAFYAGNMALTGFALALLWWYAAHRRQLLRPDIDRRRAAPITRGLVASSLVFLLSVGLTFIRPSIAVYSWALIPFLTRAVRR